MSIPELTPEGDLPYNHPLVLEALKGIIGGPIAELRASVDKNIVEQTSNTGLRVGKIDYNNILPNSNNTQHNIENYNNVSDMANNVLNQLTAPVQYNAQMPLIPLNNEPITAHARQDINYVAHDPNQMELGLFKQPEIKDIHKKLFDLETKLDAILKHVKNNKN